jgi:hypothetical protein
MADEVPFDRGKHLLLIGRLPAVPGEQRLQGPNAGLAERRRDAHSRRDRDRDAHHGPGSRKQLEQAGADRLARPLSYSPII